MHPFIEMSRRRLLGAGLASLAALGLPRSALAAIGKPEKASLKLGLPVDAASFTPAYVGMDAGIWKSVGLDVEMTIFRGDAEVSQALAGGSVDISLQSLDGLISLLNANQPVKGFYAGFYQADFAWCSQPKITSWKDMKGSSIGISSFGSMTEALSTYVLRKHGLEAMKDVNLVQVGPTASAFQGLKSGRLGAAILSPPFKWTAQDQGFHLLGTMAQEVAPQWPKHIFIATTKYLDDYPKTVETLLLGFVKSIRYARSHKAETAAILGKRLKYDPENAGKAYDEMLPSYNERGTLPEKKYMDIFWQLEVANHQVKEPWPNSKLLDDRFIKTFAEWTS